MRSMTGFGKAESALPDNSLINVEISAVNRKQLEIRASLPPDMSGLEPAARRILAGRVSRGAVNLRITRHTSRSAGGSSAVNRELFEALARECMDLRRKLGLEADFDVASLLALPGVMENAAAEVDTPEFSAAFETAVAGALEKFNAMRDAEGNALKEDMERRLQILENLLEKIRPFASGIADAIKAKLMEKLKAENLIADAGDERFLRELLFYADRADVTEEITRLVSHFAQFRTFLAKDGEPVGRSLDFLVQEMFREITTLSNKAGTPEISPLTVAFKSELEKIREQVQNVE